MTTQENLLADFVPVTVDPICIYGIPPRPEDAFFANDPNCRIDPPALIDDESSCSAPTTPPQPMQLQQNAASALLETSEEKTTSESVFDFAKIIEKIANVNVKEQSDKLSKEASAVGHHLPKKSEFIDSSVMDQPNKAVTQQQKKSEPAKPKDPQTPSPAVPKIPSSGVKRLGVWDAIDEKNNKTKPTEEKPAPSKDTPVKTTGKKTLVKEEKKKRKNKKQIIINIETFNLNVKHLNVL